MVDKNQFRKQLVSLEQQIPEEIRLQSDKLLSGRFLAHCAVKEAHTILVYMSMGCEIDTTVVLRELSAQGKCVLIPRCVECHGMVAQVYDPNRLTRHRYGMLEPNADCMILEKDEIDLILVPALCYDKNCVRMGRGGGYYDRYLESYSGKTIGLCRDILLQDLVPRDPWDRSADVVLTETKQFVCRSF